MAVGPTLPHPVAIPQISKLGVLTLYGHGIRVGSYKGLSYYRLNFRFPPRKCSMMNGPAKGVLTFWNCDAP